MNQNKSAAPSPVSQNKSGQQPNAQKGKQNQQKRQNQNQRKKETIIITERKPGGSIGLSPKPAQMNDIKQTVGHLVQNILSQEETYILPRPMGGVVAPHRYRFAEPFVPSLDGDNVAKTALVFRPDPDTFFQYTSQATTKIGDFPIVQNVDYKFSPATDMISLDATIVSPIVIKSSTATGGVIAKHFSQNSKKLVAGTKFYPGLWTYELEKDVDFSVFNPNSGAFTITGLLGYVDNAGVAVLSNTSAPVTIAGRNNLIVNFPAADITGWVAAIAINKGFWAGIQFTSVVPSVNPGFEVQASFEDMQRAPGVQWHTKSLWSMVDNGSGGIPELQFRACARFSTTGFNVLVQNVTQLLNKGGSIYAARFPGDAVIDGSVDALISRISSQTHHKLFSNQLEFGVNLPWTPEKIQDMLFQEHVQEDPYSGNPLNKPYFVVAMDFTGFTPGSQPSFNIAGGFSLEYLTTDPSNTFLKSPGCVEYFEMLCAELASIEVISENPEHLKTVANAVKNVVTSDSFRKFATTAINAGIKIAPLVLSLLV